MNTRLNINDRIKARLAELGISATEAASRAGIAASTLTRPLNDPEHPFTLSTTSLTKLCDVLDCRVGDLLSDQPAFHSIRAARVANRLGQKDVADFCGVTVQAVSQWERGETEPSLENWFRLERLFGIGEMSPTSRQSAGSSRLPELRDEIEEAYDLLTALDKTGDGIGGDIGHGVSAVTLAARSALGNALSMLKAMEGRK